MVIGSRHVMLAALVAASCTVACYAQEPPMSNGASRSAQASAVEDAMGLWRVSPRSGPGECLIALGRLPRGEAYGVQVESCSLPLFAKAVAWRPITSGFELQSRDGSQLIGFRQTGEDTFVTADGAYRLDRAPLN